jgi:hypothetical protein
VYQILAGKKEAGRVLYKNDDPEVGFLILPDLKWDQVQMKGMVSVHGRTPADGRGTRALGRWSDLKSLPSVATPPTSDTLALAHPGCPLARSIACAR